MTELIIARSSDADLVRRETKTVDTHTTHNGAYYLSDYEPISYLGNLPKPPEAATSLLLESPVPGEEKTWHAIGTGWFLSDSGNARYEEDLIAGVR